MLTVITRFAGTRLNKIVRRYFFTVILFTLFLNSETQAQHDIQFDFGVSFNSAAASADRIPFWLHVQREGRFGQTEPFFGYTGAHMTATRPLDWGFSAEAGIDVFSRQSRRHTSTVQNLYLQINNDRLRIYGGLRPEHRGFVYEELSTGSMLWSNNTAPVPKIGIETDFLPVPWTQGYLEVKGHFAHGWLDEDRYTRSPQLHEKSMYLRAGGDSGVNVHAGLVHYALFGGVTPGFGQNPASFSDFMRVVLFRGDDTDETIDGEDYALGDHLGAWDFGLTVDIGNLVLLAYRQFIIETGKELLFNTPQDGLLGLGIRAKEQKWYIDGFLYEFLDTRYQHGPFPPGEVPGQSGQKDYYNHFIYQTGWTHRDRVIGNPLLTTYPDGEIHFDRRFENNRVKAHHVGIEGTPLPDFRYRLLFTYSHNLGTYRDREIFRDLGETYRFEDGIDQYSAYIEVSHFMLENNRLRLTAGLAFDWGDLYPGNTGIFLGADMNLNHWVNR